MKKIVKQLFLFVFDIINLIRPLWRVAFIQKFKKEVHESKKEKPLYIVANGPSAKDAFEKLKTCRNSVDLCTVNFSLLTESFFEMKPELHFFADPYFFNPKTNSRLEEILNTFETKVDWNLDVFIPFSKNVFCENVSMKNKKVRIFHFPAESWNVQGIVCKKIRKEMFKKGLLTPKLQNVVVACIFNAIHLGYKNIYLFGVEHSWLNDISVDSQNRVCLIDRHYYGERTIPWKDPEGNVYKLHDLLSRLALSFLSYWELRDFAADKGDVKIINATKNSFIDAFERSN